MNDAWMPGWPPRDLPELALWMSTLGGVVGGVVAGVAKKITGVATLEQEVQALRSTMRELRREVERMDEVGRDERSDILDRVRRGL